MELSEDQLDMLCRLLPDEPARPKGGRPRTDKRKAIAGIFWILDNGAKWEDLPSEFGTKSSVHRAFQRWVNLGAFEQLLAEVGAMVEERGGFKLYECFIDGTFSKAKGGGDGIGGTKAGKGVKIMIMVDARGLPVAVNTGSASPHESKLVEPLFDFMVTVDFPERLVGDKAYDSDKLDETLAGLGVDMISPHRSNRKPGNRTQDGRKLRRYKRRWTVERTIGWLQNYRRLCIRWEKSTAMFQGFVNLTCSILLMKQVLG
ncbi:IS5 family transposase [Luteolibacter flavescens]|uniref:IS5 family transposase n=2 Tax=Luteolibacter flavescens TaxID=1859460 RepID=A0ABT3FPR7_9BACT|nr:IS5 family transposase [Luteolibacter flavescens]